MNVLLTRGNYGIADHRVTVNPGVGQPDKVSLEELLASENATAPNSPHFGVRDSR